MQPQQTAAPRFHMDASARRSKKDEAEGST
jgi:hypothetical protein